MTDGFDVRIAPEPSPEDRDAILATVRTVLGREAELATPSAWRLAGWTDKRVGIKDLAQWVPSHRRWALSVRFPTGGRVFPGMNGRGDAK